MRRSSWAMLVLVCALGATLVYLKGAARPSMSDEEHIHALLGKCESAIERKDLNGTLSCFSRDYSDPNGYSLDTLRAQGIQDFRADGEFDVTLQNISLQVLGDAAAVHAEAFIVLTSKDGLREKVFDSPVTVNLKRENARRWLIIPCTEWKVTGISGLPEGWEE